jgi:hypothetical protein
VSVLRALWLMPLAFALHEAEEWNIRAWDLARWDNPPPYGEPTVRTWLVLVTLFAVLWTTFGAASRRPRFAAMFVLPFFVLTCFANVLQHLALSAIDRAYNPGLITAALLLGPAIAAATLIALRDKAIPRWYVALLYLLALPQAIAIARAGRTLPGGLRAIYDLSAPVARWLYGTT